MVAPSPFGFELPDALLAREPPEKRGLERDQVRLLAVDRRTGALRHTRFNRIGDLLRPGDCLVFNASRTLPAALQAVFAKGPCEGQTVRFRLARGNEDDTWSALPLTVS